MILCMPKLSKTLYIMNFALKFIQFCGEERPRWRRNSNWGREKGLSLTIGSFFTLCWEIMVETLYQIYILTISITTVLAHQGTPLSKLKSSLNYVFYISLRYTQIQILTHISQAQSLAPVSRNKVHCLIIQTGLSNTFS